MKTRFELKPVPPFRLDLTAWALRRRPENMIDAWDGNRYSRVLHIRNRPVLVEVEQTSASESPILLVTAGCSSSLKENLVKSLRWILSTHVDLTPFYRMAGRRPEIKSIVARFRGVKPPRFPSVFEALINGISCQQLSLAVGITLLNRLALFRGAAVGERHAFPRPEDLEGVRESTLRKMGYSGSKARSILGVSKQIHQKLFNPDELQGIEDETDLTGRLDDLPGVGPWTAEYVMLRGLGRISVFPGNDVGARRNLSRFIRSGQEVSYEEIGRLRKEWYPFGGLIYFHLLLSGLSEKGWVS